MNFFNNWIILSISAVGWIVFIPFVVLPQWHLSSATALVFAVISFVLGVQQAKKARGLYLLAKEKNK